MKPLWKQVTIIGIGLIGGSLGMAIKDKGLAQKVVGVDLNQEILSTAVDLEAIDVGSVDLIEGVREADLVVLAAPVNASINILREIAPHLKFGCMVTDVGSTKEAIVEIAGAVMPDGVCFIGGHPMAGSEQAGIAGADLYLFENAVYILTTTPDIPKKSVEKLKTMCTAIGARVIETNPHRHDVLVAGISHLPHIVAAALVNTVGGMQEQYPEILALAAGGFRDTTRIASGEPLMWRDICTTNSEKILSLIREFKNSLEKIENQIANQNPDGIERDLSKAREIRNNIPVKMKGYLPELFEIVIFVPDRPGVIADIAVLLGDAGININDIEILRVKEGEGGSIRLGFGSADEQERAVDLLKKNNIKAKLKN